MSLLLEHIIHFAKVFIFEYTLFIPQSMYVTIYYMVICFKSVTCLFVPSPTSSGKCILFFLPHIFFHSKYLR